MREINPSNIITLFILFWTANIPATIQSKQLSLQNLTEAEQTLITSILKELDVHNRKTFTFRKTELPQYILGMSYELTLECYVELSPFIFQHPVNKYFKATLYHEIGHCFGLDHSNSKYDIMYHEAKKDSTYTQLDWDWFKKQLRGCF